MAKTITALSTPPGIGGIAVIRLSGDKAFEVSDCIFRGKIRLADAPSHTIYYGKVYVDEMLIDTVTAAVFRNPNSYTGEDVVEISCHGGYIVSKQIIDALLLFGADLAEPGEFTKRAFLNGKLDLSQVEAVADLIHAQSKPAAQTSARQLTGNFTKRINQILDLLLHTAGLLELELDFAEEDLEFVDRRHIKDKIEEAAKFCLDLHLSHHSAEILRNGYYVGIAGYPNSGKSTLFNTLLQKHRAIVSPIPGTTRDYIEESIYINDVQVRLVDTAGIRETDDLIEVEGVKLVDSILKQADLVLIINDISKGIDYSDSLLSGIHEKYPDTDAIVLHNKMDLLVDPAQQIENAISAKKNIGIESLKNIIGERAVLSVTREQDVLVNQRQSLLLIKAKSLLERAAEAIGSNIENDLIAIDIRDAAKTLSEITGNTWSEAVLNEVFSKFCIGK